MTESDLSTWHHELAKRVSPGTQATELSHVLTYFRWLVRMGYRPDDPSARLDRPRLPRRLPRPIPDAQLARALDGAPERVKPWLFLACYQGLRACEVANLRREDVLDNSDPPLLIVTSGKGAKPRILPLHPEVLPLLPAGPGWLFLRRDGKPGPVNAHLVSILANRYLRDAKIGSTFHSLRHWFLTGVYKASLDLRLTQELAGHSSPATTAGYAAFAQERSAPVVRSLRIHDAEPPLDPAA